MAIEIMIFGTHLRKICYKLNPFLSINGYLKKKYCIEKHFLNVYISVNILMFTISRYK